MTRYRWDCEKQGCRMKARWDPQELDGLLPRGSSFGDMDAWAEINGHFLFIEQKGAGVDPTTGQRIALEQLAQLPHCTVLVVRDHPSGGYEFRNMKTPSRPFRLVTVDEFKRMIAAWGAWADRKTSARIPA